MQTTKHILSALLIVTMLSTGLPVFNPEDTNLSNRAMLEHAILSAQALAHSAQNAGSFKAEMKKTLSSLYVAAGLQTAITTDNEDKSAFTFSSSDSPFIISSYYLLSSSYYNESIYNLNISYQSFVCNLTPPPPNTA
ncbi:hypothetical protein QUF90_16610 [Desulfococcaceae bacterium HSG9]|nr:hypothetical protein [Desulfococcaceae bacterium HSG9]